METELNENDNKLIAFCWNRPRSLTEIAKYLNISVKNVSVRIYKLEKANLIKTHKTSDKRKTYIRSVKGDKTKKYFLEILEALEEKGGSMTLEDFIKLLPYEFGKEDDIDKFSAITKIQYVYPALVEKRIQITPKGKKFLEENNK